jgi:hypothetical protein
MTDQSTTHPLGALRPNCAADLKKLRIELTKNDSDYLPLMSRPISGSLALCLVDASIGMPVRGDWVRSGRSASAATEDHQVAGGAK